jgi:predicted HAD superfamily Cof-like phosphohydrolase
VTSVKAEFIAAAVAEQEYTGGSVEICAVLNRLPDGFLSGTDDQLIDAVDALMDDLYRQGELVCQGIAG